MLMLLMFEFVTDWVDDYGVAFMGYIVIISFDCMPNVHILLWIKYVYLN